MRILCTINGFSRSFCPSATYLAFGCSLLMPAFFRVYTKRPPRKFALRGSWFTLIFRLSRSTRQDISSSLALKKAEEAVRRSSISNTSFSKVITGVGSNFSISPLFEAANCEIAFLRRRTRVSGALMSSNSVPWLFFGDFAFSGGARGAFGVPGASSGSCISTLNYLTL